MAGLALLLTSACSLGPGESPVTPEGSDALPSRTATDWVTYADHLVQIRVVSERRVPPTKEEQDAGEGIIGREVTVTREAVLWTRPGAKEEAPGSIVWAAGGWNFHGKDERPLHFDGVPSLLPGHRYLVPIVHMALSLDGSGTPTWLPLSGTAMLPFDDGVVGDGEQITDFRGTYDGHSGGETPMRDSVWGKGARAVVEALTTTEPDPAAAPYMSKVPRARYEAAVRGTDTVLPAPGPGEKP
jgi:hypothetical protein